MQLNEIHNEHEHAPSSTKIALLIFAVILVTALGYLVWASNKQTVSEENMVIKKTSTTATATSTATTATVTTDTVYTNTDYGFTMTLTNNWKGYKIKTVKPTDGTAVAYLHINVPTTDAGWVDDSPDSFTHYASMMVIGVYTTAEWDTIQASGEPTDKKLTQNSQYVFGYSQAQSIPTDLTAAYKEVAAVAATFKLK